MERNENTIVKQLDSHKFCAVSFSLRPLFLSLYSDQEWKQTSRETIKKNEDVNMAKAAFG
jgi:hypothetical protein